MKRIDIQWNLGMYRAGLDASGEFRGVVTIWEGKEVDGMEPTSSFRIEKGKHFTRYLPFNTGGHLPKPAEKDDEMIKTMANCFYSGITRNGRCYYWAERE